MNSKRATLDLSGCQSLEELHQRIKTALDFPQHYGKNLDAFWDCINCESDVNFVSIVGSRDVADHLKPTVEKIFDMLQENKQEWANTDCPFDYEIVE